MKNKYTQYNTLVEKYSFNKYKNLFVLESRSRRMFPMLVAVALTLYHRFRTDFDDASVLFIFDKLQTCSCLQH